MANINIDISKNTIENGKIKLLARCVRKRYIQKHTAYTIIICECTRFDIFHSMCTLYISTLNKIIMRIFSRQKYVFMIANCKRYYSLDQSFIIFGLI